MYGEFLNLVFRIQPGNSFSIPCVATNNKKYKENIFDIQGISIIIFNFVVTQNK